MKRALLRESSDRLSATCGALGQGEIVTAVEVTEDGTRVRFEGGWASVKSSKGNVLLKEWKDDDDEEEEEEGEEAKEDTDTVKEDSTAKRPAETQRDGTAERLAVRGGSASSFAVKQGSKKLELVLGSLSLEVFKVPL